MPFDFKRDFEEPLERLKEDIEKQRSLSSSKADGLFAARLLGHVAGKVKKIHPEDAATRARFDSLEFEGDAEGVKPFVSDKRKRKAGKKRWIR